GRGELVRDLEALASIVADQTSAALAFEDPGSAAEVLRSLRGKRHVASGAVSRLDGRRFASYSGRGEVGRCPERAPQRGGLTSLPGQRIGGGVAEQWVPIIAGDHPVGIVFLRSDLRYLERGLRLQAL